MSEEIKTGDLVVIVKPSCCAPNGGALGKIFLVHHINNGISICEGCGAEIGAGRAIPIDGFFGYAISRLRKIHPLTEPEQVTDRITEKV